MASLAQDLHVWSSVLRDASLLEVSLRIQQDVLDSTPQGHSERVLTLARLGDSLVRLFEMTEDTTLLFDAIVMLKEAKSLCPLNNPHFSYEVGNLGLSLAPGDQSAFRVAYPLAISAEISESPVHGVSSLYHEPVYC